MTTELLGPGVLVIDCEVDSDPMTSPDETEPLATTDDDVAVSMARGRSLL